MTAPQKLEIINALIDIKSALVEHNILINNLNINDGDYISYVPLSKAFVTVNIISLRVKGL